MRNLFVLLSAFVVLAPAALPQASKWTLPQTGLTQSEGRSNAATAEVLKQLASNGFAQGTAVPVQQQRSPLLQIPQVSPWTGPFAKIGPYGLDPGIRRQELVGMLPNPPRACAIPLLEVPVDGTLDKGILIPHGMQPGSSADPKMAVPPPAPACENQPSPLPKLKAK